ncbi:hypothetical protein HanPI659440_Chr01g0020511 [Helianthus annuus]|nr:hypothetical protein HanPI659440_Chr01g0020511 [Helianthus annuus]
MIQTEVMVGQTVTGVVEATFDAGYLLAVRIGNSKITLRGAVFKPGHTAPVTPENDVAPHVEMIKRTEIPFPTELQPKRRRKRRSKEKKYAACYVCREQVTQWIQMHPQKPTTG